jgi:hypothetical protein
VTQKSISRLLQNYCATLIRACAVLGILMYFLCALRFLRSGRTRLKAARDVFQQPVKGLRDLWAQSPLRLKMQRLE